MTREEAIKRLKEYAQYSYGIYHNGEEDEIAFDMAIKALEQEPTAEYSSDIISREEVKNKLQRKTVKNGEKMSISIKGIEMPKEPWECPCHNGEDGRCNVTQKVCVEIPKDCPLVSVPPQDDIARYTKLTREALEQEPKHGKWVKKEHLVPLPWDCSPMNPDNYDSDTHSEYEWYWHCSECDYEGDRQFRPSWKYCPNCGAKMESGEE